MVMVDALRSHRSIGSMRSSFVYTQASRSILIAVATLFISETMAFGQSLNNAEEIPIRVNFSVFAFDRLSDIHFISGDRAGGSPLTFYSSDRSPVYTYEGLNPIVFYRETPAPTDLDAKAVKRIKVGEISLPHSAGDFLFIFFPNPDPEEEGYRIYPIDDSLSALPYGSLRFFNTSSQQLIGKLGKTRVSVGRGLSKVYSLSGNSHSLAFGFEHEGQYYASYQNTFQLGEHSRGIFMISPPFIKGSALLQTRFLSQTSASGEID